MAASSETKGDSSKNGQGEPASKQSTVDDEDYGYYFFPERNGEGEGISWWDKIWNREHVNHFKCNNMVESCFRSSKFFLEIEIIKFN